MGYEEIGVVAGHALFGATLAGLYGLTKVLMQRPMSEGTSGWTPSGSRLRLTRLVAAHGSFGTALLTLADEDAVSTERLHKAMVLLEQLLTLQHQLEAADPEAYEPIDQEKVIAKAERIRTIVLGVIMHGLREKETVLTESGIPRSPHVQYAVSTVVRCVHDVMTNLHIIVRKWDGENGRRAAEEISKRTAKLSSKPQR